MHSLYAIAAEQDNLKQDNKIFLLYDRLMFKEVANLYGNNVDINKLSPYSLIILCYTLNELEHDINTFLYKRNVEDHIVKFLLSFDDLINGKVESAEMGFHKLRNSSGNGKYLGMIGLFEYEIFTLNYNGLKIQIESEKNRTDINTEDKNKVIEYYSLLYSRFTGDMNNVVKILNKLDHKEIEEDFELLIIEVETNIYKNHIDEALKAVDNIINKFGSIQEALLLKYKLIMIKYGNIKGIDFLEKEITANNKLWQLKLNKYFHDLKSNDDFIRNKAINNIIITANDRKHDIRSLLMICNELIDNEYYIESGKLINDLFKRIDNQSKFFMSNFFMSKFFYTTNKKDDFKKSYNTAMQQSKNDINFLWFQYNIAIDIQDDNEALKILDQILLFDPFDISAIYEKIVIYVNMQDWNNAILCAKKIYNSRRFIELPIRNNINMLLKKSSFNLD